MRFKNTSEIKIVPSIYMIVVAVFVTNIFVNIELMASDSQTEVKWNHFLPNIVAILFGIYFHRIAQLFEFDSDGETLNFKNNGVFFSKFMEYRVKRAEFPKGKLIDFSFFDVGLYSSLKIIIQSKRKKGPRSYTFNTTFLSRKKKRGMKESLRKVVEKNNLRT